MRGAVAVLRRSDPSVTSLRDATPDLLTRRRDALSEVEYARAEHVVTENVRVLETIAALEAGDLDAVGRTFAASHASLRDRFEVSSPELDAMVEIAISVPGVVAARMTGAGFGGCTINLVRPDAVEALRATVERDYPARTGFRRESCRSAPSRAPAASPECPRPRRATDARAPDATTSTRRSSPDPTAEYPSTRP